MKSLNLSRVQLARPGIQKRLRLQDSKIEGSGGTFPKLGYPNIDPNIL